MAARRSDQLAAETRSGPVASYARLDSTAGASDSGSDSGSGSSVPPCCAGKVGLLPLLGAFGAIGAVSLFLRQAAIENLGGRRRKRALPDQSDDEFAGLFLKGKREFA